MSHHSLFDDDDAQSFVQLSGSSAPAPSKSAVSSKSSKSSVSSKPSKSSLSSKPSKSAAPSKASVSKHSADVCPKGCYDKTLFITFVVISAVLALTLLIVLAVCLRNHHSKIGDKVRSVARRMSRAVPSSWGSNRNSVSGGEEYTDPWDNMPM